MTIKNIAKIAGVSRGTVDRVLNRRGGVSRETAARILRIAEDLHYVPSMAGRNLAAKKKKWRFAYIAMHPADPFVTYYLPPGICDEQARLAEYGVRVDIYHFAMNNVQEETDLLDRLHSERVHGIALLPVSSPIVCDKMRQLAADGIALVTYGSDLPGSDRIAYVGINHHSSGRTAAQMIRLLTHGPAKVGVITSGNILIHSRDERMDGFEEKLREDYPEIRIVQKAVIQDDDFICYATLRDMLASHRDMDALFVNACGTIGACHALRDHPSHVRSVFYADESQAGPYLKEGVLDVLLNKYPYQQGNLPLQVLYEYISTSQKPKSDAIYTNLSILVKENL